MNQLTTISRVLDQMFPEFVDESPKIEIRKGDDQYIVHAELPGYSDKDIEISYENRFLTLSGKRELQENKTKLIHSEFSVNQQFNRRIEFGTPVDADSIDARMKNGILTVTLPFSEKVKVKMIEVKS